MAHLLGWGRHRLRRATAQSYCATVSAILSGWAGQVSLCRGAVHVARRHVGAGQLLIGIDNPERVMSLHEAEATKAVAG